MLNRSNASQSVSLSIPNTWQPLARQGLFTLMMLSLLAFGLPAPAKTILPDNLEDISYKPLVPTREQSRTSVNILDQLNYAHYHEMAIDDGLSKMVFDRYLEDLDGSKIYFLASDIKDFEKYRYSLDNALKSGNLKPGFDIYNRYQQRVIERLTFVIDRLEKGFKGMEFDDKEYLETNRDDAPWPTTEKELDQLWEKRIKGAVLGLKLTGKPMDEIQELLIKRYRSQLNRTLQVNNEDAFQTYINALAQSYDPHTLYFSPRNSENFNINMSLQLEGIGAVLQTENEYTKVVRLVPAGPADKSNLLHPADRIVGVAQGEDGEMVDVIGWRIDEVVDLIRGPKGSLVRLEVIPNNSANQRTKEIRITRNTVKLEEQAAQSKVLEVETEDRPYKLGVIEIPTFYLDFRAMQNRDPNARSTTRDVKRLLVELQKEDIDGLIIDLRNNGGGALQEVNSLLGLFIKTGPTVQVQDDRGRVDQLKDRDPRIYYNGPLAVLVNRLSASASEIFAGAVQDYQRGLVLGSQTFGKGTVQALRSLNRGQLKITQAKFYRISGESNQSLGVIPDVQFPSIYDAGEIGESALPNALPWDEIAPARFEPYANLEPFKSDLISMHQKRVQEDPDFQHLVEQIAMMEDNRSQTKISLSEEERLKERDTAEQDRLALENKRRKAKGEEPLKSLEELDEEGTDPNLLAEESLEDDVLLVESGNILVDYINLNQRRVAKHEHDVDQSKME